MTTFRKVDEREAYRSARLTLQVATYEDPEGRRFERALALHPGAVGIVPVVEDGQAALLVRQYRAPIDQELLEIPAGLRDVEGESTEDTARRELIEEAGMQAGRLEKLCQFYNSAGFSDELTHVFMALDLTPCPASPQEAEEHYMTVETVWFDEVAGLVARGAICDAKTIIGLSLAREALR